MRLQSLTAVTLVSLILLFPKAWKPQEMEELFFCCVTSAWASYSKQMGHLCPCLGATSAPASDCPGASWLLPGGADTKWTYWDGWVLKVLASVPETLSLLDVCSHVAGSPPPAVAEPCSPKPGDRWEARLAGRRDLASSLFYLFIHSFNQPFLSLAWSTSLCSLIH